MQHECSSVHKSPACQCIRRADSPRRAPGRRPAELEVRPVYTAIFFNLAISDAHWHGQPGEPEPRCHEFYYVTLATHTQSCDQDSILAAVNAAAAAVSESQASRGSVTGYHGSVTVPVCHTGDRSASTELASRGPCRSRRTVPDSAATRAAHGMVLAVLWLAISKS